MRRPLCSGALGPGLADLCLKTALNTVNESDTVTSSNVKICNEYRPNTYIIMSFPQTST